MQSVCGGCLFDFLRSVSVSIVSWRRRALYAQKTEKKRKEAEEMFDVNQPPPTTKTEMPMR